MHGVLWTVAIVTQSCTASASGTAKALLSVVQHVSILWRESMMYCWHEEEDEKIHDMSNCPVVWVHGTSSMHKTQARSVRLGVIALILEDAICSP